MSRHIYHRIVSALSEEFLTRFAMLQAVLVIFLGF